MATRNKILDELAKELAKVRFLSPNEPLTRYGVARVVKEMSDLTDRLSDAATGGSLSMTLWDSTSTYDKDDVVVYFKEESRQTSVEQGRREFVFVLMSLSDGNTNVPNYDIVDHVPVFDKSNWRLLNPLSYLLQNLDEMRTVVMEAFRSLMSEHVAQEHGFVGSADLEDNLIRKDYSNLTTPWTNGKYSLTTSTKELSQVGWSGCVSKSSNGIMEYSMKYGFEIVANSQDRDHQILDRRHYVQRSPIWDESDNTIFSQKYVEDDMFSVVLRKESGGTNFNNLRYGTNVFFRKVELPEPFADDEYCVFFDTHPPGSFAFGYDKADLESKVGPTYDMVVSMPMIMNKTASGFTIVLPIHTYFNSMKKYNIGVPWKNEFRLQAIGRFR